MLNFRRLLEQHQHLDKMKTAFKTVDNFYDLADNKNLHIFILPDGTVVQLNKHEDVKKVVGGTDADAPREAMDLGCIRAGTFYQDFYMAFVKDKVTYAQGDVVHDLLGYMTNFESAYVDVFNKAKDAVPSVKKTFPEIKTEPIMSIVKQNYAGA